MLDEPSTKNAADLFDPQKSSRDYAPSYFDTVRWDPTLHLPKSWREQQLKDQSRWTRKYLLPLVKVICWTLIKITRVIKRVSPVKIFSWKALNFLSTWFVNNCMSAESQHMLFRHFALEASVVNFIADNSKATDVAKVDLYPISPDQLGDVGGFNATLLHDCNVMNLFIDLGKSKDANIYETIKKEDIDFSSLILPEAKVEEDGRKRLMNLDLETSLYIMILFLVLLFDEDVAESAANSLSLDEGILTILSTMTGDNQYQNWSPYRYTNLVFWPNDPALGLQKHMVIFEYIYTRLLMQKDGIKNPLDLEV